MRKTAIFTGLAALAAIAATSLLVTPSFAGSRYGYEDGDVRAPYARVHTGHHGVRVRAPYTGVHVDNNRWDGDVRVRAPFTDLDNRW